MSFTLCGDLRSRIPPINMIPVGDVVGWLLLCSSSSCSEIKYLSQGLVLLLEWIHCLCMYTFCLSTNKSSLWLYPAFRMWSKLSFGVSFGLLKEKYPSCYLFTS